MAPAALLLLDEDLRYVRVNETLAQINGKSVDDHIGRTISEVMQDAAAIVEPQLREVLRSGEQIENLPFELHGRTYNATFFPVYDEHHDINGLGGIIIDITDHRRLEEDLRAAVEMRERVLAVVSHDLRNPLNAIELAMSTMPRSTFLDRDAARRIQIVERAAKMMEKLISDLLDIASIQAGKLSLHLENEDVVAIVHEVVEQHAPLAAEKSLSLVDETRLASAMVQCDRVRLLQVLGNLCGNAIKFCRPGDRITVAARRRGDHLEIEVSDSGPGIPGADLPHLFEPYWSTARGRQRGTGLGLFISNAIIDAHHGTIHVDSAVGAGSSFRIYLPLREAR